jgi:Fe-S-cluster containining protein
MTALDSLYARIPPVKGCIKGCADCCGPVPMRPEEQRRIPSVMRPAKVGEEYVTPTKHGCMTCAYATADGCSIYSTRPLMCRLFGAVDQPMMTCPHGARAKRPLTSDQSDALLREYQAL